MFQCTRTGGRRSQAIMSPLASSFVCLPCVLVQFFYILFLISFFLFFEPDWQSVSLVASEPGHILCFIISAADDDTCEWLQTNPGSGSCCCCCWCSCCHCRLILLLSSATFRCGSFAETFSWSGRLFADAAKCEKRMCATPADLGGWV